MVRAAAHFFSAASKTETLSAVLRASRSNHVNHTVPSGLTVTAGPLALADVVGDVSSSVRIAAGSADLSEATINRQVRAVRRIVPPYAAAVRCQLRFLGRAQLRRRCSNV